MPYFYLRSFLNTSGSYSIQIINPLQDLPAQLRNRIYRLQIPNPIDHQLHTHTQLLLKPLSAPILPDLAQHETMLRHVKHHEDTQEVLGPVEEIGYHSFPPRGW